METIQHLTSQWDAIVNQIVLGNLETPDDELTAPTHNPEEPENRPPEDIAAQTRILFQQATDDAHRRSTPHNHPAGDGDDEDDDPPPPFRPGLHPRCHATHLDATRPTPTAEPGIPWSDFDHVSDTAIDLWHQALGHRPRQTPSTRRQAARRQATRRQAPAVKPTLDPQGRHNRKRLRQARNHLARFDVRNRYQRELRALCLAMLSYMETTCLKPGAGGEFDRWWRIVCEYGRV
ncbi:MAG: hypothetical protein AAF657_40155, partial [Acidobacteriota bacterium]